MAGGGRNVRPRTPHYWWSKLSLSSRSSGPNPNVKEEESATSATLEVTRNPPLDLAEVRRNTFDVIVDGERVGSFGVHDSFETPVAPGPHTLKIRDGRFSSRELSFQVTDGQVVSFNCQGRRITPTFLASFVVPSLGLKLTRA